MTGRTIRTVRIGRLRGRHAGELLTVQRAAYVTEAQRYATAALPPLVETVDQVRADLLAPSVVALGAWLGPRLVGSVRGRTDGDRMEVARLAVAPDVQGRGVGRRLLAAVERAAPPGVRTLWLVTGHASDDALRLYRRAGYARVDAPVDALVDAAGDTPGDTPDGTVVDAAGVALAMLEKGVQRRRRVSLMPRARGRS